jgi:hypothetical protein
MYCEGRCGRSDVPDVCGSAAARIRMIVAAVPEQNTWQCGMNKPRLADLPLTLWTLRAIAM